MNAKTLSVIRYQNDINTEHNMKLCSMAHVVDARQWLSEQSAWLAMDKLFETEKFETEKAQTFFYHSTTGVCTI